MKLNQRWNIQSVLSNAETVVAVEAVAAEEIVVVGELRRQEEGEIVRNLSGLQRDTKTFRHQSRQFALIIIRTAGKHTIVLTR